MVYARHLLAVLLILALTPGVGEAMENLGHLALEGHLAHTSGHQDDHPNPGPEHGCNGPFHICPCHVSQSFVNGGHLGIRAPEPPVELLPSVQPLSLRSGYHRVPDQPPNRSV